MTDVSGGWRELEDELAAWQAAGRTATLWWRDDDAVEPTPALERLLDLAARNRVPIALAVIPARASHRLPAYLADADGQPSLLQHGFAHQNHAGEGQKKIELGGTRTIGETREALARGTAIMGALFPTRDGASTALPVLVPPWNRIDEELPAALPELGFTGLSTHGPRPVPQTVPGLRQVNTHVDIMRWAAPRGFLGVTESLGQLTRHLEARRSSTVDAEEPSGLLTHHLAHDEPAWRFLEELLPRLMAHLAVRFQSAEEVFSETGEAKAGQRS